jgi:tetratricopeptide (TPR) repeat protein
MTFTPERVFRGLAASLALLAVAGCNGGEDARTPFARAQDALAAGDGLGAEIALRTMLDAGTPQEELAAYMGEAELLQGQTAEARNWLGTARFSDKTAAHGFHMLGRLEMQEGNLAGAGQAFDRSYREEPDNAELWTDIGRLRFRGGEQVQAIEASKRAVEIDPENPRALQFRAQLVRDAQGLAAALPWFEAALEHNANDVDLLADYAATLGDLGRATDMLAVVRRMAAIDARDPRVHYLQAVLAARAGRFDLARTLLGKMGTAMGDVPAVMLLAGVVDLENGNYESAAQAFDRLAVLQPDNARVRSLLARAIALGLNDRELTYRFAGAARSKAASPYLQLSVARAHEALGAREEAAQLLDAAAAGRSGRLVAVRAGTPLAVAATRRNEGGVSAQALVRGRIVGGQTSEALREAEAFRKRFPGSGDALALAGDARLAARDTRGAMELYRQAAEIRQTWPLVERMVGALLAEGRDVDAAVLLARHLQGNPMNGEAAGLLARRAMAAREWERAGALLDHALAHGGHRDPALWAMRSLVASERGEGDLALEAIAHAHALQPLRRDSAAELARVLKGRGEPSLALAGR